MAYPFIVQGTNIIVVIDNQSFTISKSHIAYDKIRDAIKAQDWDTVRDNITPKRVILNYGSGNIAIKGDELTWKGTVLHNSLTKRMVQMFQEGFPIEPLVLFMENLMQNPSKRAVDELYGFLEKGNLPITPDGHFLAYKKVRDDYLDVHSGTVLNKPAYLMTESDYEFIKNSNLTKVKVEVINNVTTISMERNEVDDDRHRTCSSGLHFCSQEYLDHFGGNRVMILKIHPKSVVSIPSDYNDSKGRCCEYQVIGQVGVNSDLVSNKAVQSDVV